MEGPGLVTLSAPIRCLDGFDHAVLFARWWAPAEARLRTRGEWLDADNVERAPHSAFVLVARRKDGVEMLAVPVATVIGFLTCEEPPSSGDHYDVELAAQGKIK